MSKQKVIQTNFTGGELSPLMFGRVDTVKYQNGAAKLKNMLVRQQGGLWMRGGSRFVHEVKDSSKKTFIYEFEYSDVQSYIIEFGDLYIRIYYDGGFVETAPASGVPLEVVTTYVEADLETLVITQSADVLYVTHKNYPPRKIRRLGANSWDIVDCDFQDGPYITDVGIDATLTVSNVTSIAKAVSTAAFFSSAPVTSKVISAVNKVGSFYEFTTSTNHGWSTGQIVNISNVSFLHTAMWGRQVNTPIDGQYSITVVAVNKFYATTGWFNAENSANIISWSVTGALAQTVGTAQHFEYRKDNNYVLAKIITVTDTTHADVFVLSNVKTDISKYAKITVNTGDSPATVNSTLSDVFSLNDIGKYVRTTAGNWFQITGFNSTQQCTVGSIITLINYSPDVLTVSVGASTVQCQVTSDVNLFASTDVSRHIRFNFGGKRPWGKITNVFSATSISVILYAEMPVDPTNVAKLYNNGVTNLWQLGAWYTGNFPRAISFHEQRLWFGGSIREPLNFWGSQPNDYENMAPTEYDSVVLDTSAINYSLVANKANPILWLLSANTLLIGTQSSEWQVKAASSINQPITPTNINATEQTNNGSLAGCRPIKLGNAIGFIQKAGRKMIEIAYDFQQDSFVGKNLCVVSEHILRKGGKAKSIAYQREPSNVVWVALTDGTLAALTYEKEQQVLAWHPHDLGGNGIVESLAVANSAAGTEELLYMVVKRTINGSQKRYIEYFTTDFYPVNETDISDAYHLDCGLSYSGAPTTTITGLTHLNGETVDVVADGVYVNTKLVAGGQITLATAASKVHVGYKYTGYVKLLPLEGASPTGGTSQGKTKRIARTVVRVFSTRDFKYGTDLQRLDVKKIVDGNGVPTTKLASEDLGINIPMNYNYTAMFYLVQDQPYPFTVLAVAPDAEVTT